MAVSSAINIRPLFTGYPFQGMGRFIFRYLILQIQKFVSKYKIYKKILQNIHNLLKAIDWVSKHYYCLQIFWNFVSLTISKRFQNEKLEN